MNENFIAGQGELFTLTDDDGKEQLFELLGKLELDDTTYYALVPQYEDPNDELQDDGELIILKEDPNNDPEDPENASLITIEDEDEFNTVGEIFLECINKMFEANSEDFDDDDYISTDIPYTEQ